jgi:two-component system response regulator HydG
LESSFNILVVDDDRRMAKTLVDILRVKGYDAQAAYTGMEALQKLTEAGVGCVLTDVKMPAMNGVELFQVIKETYPDLPVVLMTAYATDELVQKGLQQGAIAAISKPLDLNLLLSFFNYVSQERTVVIVDDDLQFCEFLENVLQIRGYNTISVSDPQAVLEAIQPDVQVVLLDLKLNGTNGLDVLRQIRGQYPQLPVILVTGYREELAENLLSAQNLNILTCLYKPFQVAELIQQIYEIRHRSLCAFWMNNQR